MKSTSDGRTVGSRMRVWWHGDAIGVSGLLDHGLPWPTYVQEAVLKLLWRLHATKRAYDCLRIPILQFA